MSGRDSAVIFDAQFQVTSVDKDGKKFDRVSRITADSDALEMNLSLDMNSELYPLREGDVFTLVLATTLSLGGAGAEGAGEGRDAWRVNAGKPSLADEYEYVMYGKVYKFDEGTSETVTVYASFGGLLLALTGSFRHVSEIVVGSNVYLLMRR